MSNSMNVNIVVEAMDRFTAPAKKVAGVSVVMAGKLHAAERSIASLDKTSGSISRFKALKTSIADNNH